MVAQQSSSLIKHIKFAMAMAYINESNLQLKIVYDIDHNGPTYF
jgi:hypothetical protein